jgi:hypothetical protein
LPPSTWAGITPEGPAGEFEDELKIVDVESGMSYTPNHMKRGGEGLS